jgi:hypothetical protein
VAAHPARARSRWSRRCSGRSGGCGARTTRSTPTGSRTSAAWRATRWWRSPSRGPVFFEIPPPEAEVKVAAFLALTIAPLAVAGPFLVPLLDRAGTASGDLVRGGRGPAPWCASTPRPGSAPCSCSPARSCSWCSRRCTRSRRTGSRSRTRDRTRASSARTLASGRIATGGAVLAAGPAFGLLQLGGRGGRPVRRRRRLRDRRGAEPPPAPPEDARRAGRGLQARRDPAAHRAGDRRGGAARRERVPAVRAGVRAPAQRRADVVVRRSSRVRPRRGRTWET